MRRGGEKDGSVDNWKGVQREEEGDRKKQASKEAGPAECVCGEERDGRGEGEGEDALAGWLAPGGRWRERKQGRAGRLQKEGLVAHVLPCRPHVYPHLPLADLLTPFPSPSTKRNGRRARRQSNDLCTLDRIHRRFTRSNPALHAYVYVSYAGRPGTDR